ncbi:hypothetical protein AX17_004696 [Amanita inopinata Kibby_2008]|nr:hypothetical protein AX17_004696 [Amanita inopinata Kibby_2008]
MLNGSDDVTKLDTIVELANALSTDIPGIPFAVMADDEYRRALDHMADYRTTLDNLTNEIVNLHNSNDALQREVDSLKEQLTKATTAKAKTQSAPKEKATKTSTMTTEQHAKMISKMIEKHQSKTHTSTPR